ncbi:hypothetical protein EYF80_019798 [Liparis tanakae]|uniref:Uncharacterized protein n=1 Tax=Liparis tanakae TaxID=230148 RepID=A0A4Z2HX64_9TELE|nr:hypothetical protein EYF80_019798 [Liparis tanakae]
MRQKVRPRAKGQEAGGRRQEAGGRRQDPLGGRRSERLLRGRGAVAPAQEPQPAVELVVEACGRLEVSAGENSAAQWPRLSVTLQPV